MTTHTDTRLEACDCPSCSDGPGEPQSLQACPTPGHGNRVCEGCGSKLKEWAPKNKRFCSKKCQHSTYERERSSGAGASIRMNLSSGSIGAVGELIACADLMKAGFDVFRAVSQASSCDLVIVGDFGVRRIEVRTGFVRKDGTIGWPRHSRDEGRYDNYAVIVHKANGPEVHYFPELRVDCDAFERADFQGGPESGEEVQAR